MIKAVMLELKEISKVYDGQPLLNGISFSVGEEETACILGPSGVGKSTLLRIIAGLENPRSGQVFWDGRDISDLPPYQREFGFMFQDYALFPHLDVFENIAFGLRMQHVPSDEIKSRVLESLAMVGLENLVDRLVADLSGGEKQRVAFARALAPKPKLLMLDEPMGSLDRALRAQLTKELHILLAEMDIPVIYVTHDQEEAFAIADKLIILNEGCVVQSGTPQDVYMRPLNLWVASFFGLNNQVLGRIVSLSPVVVKTEIGEVIVTSEGRGFSVGDQVDLVFPPAALKIEKQKSPKIPRNYFIGTVVDAIFKGDNYTSRVIVGEHTEFAVDILEKRFKNTEIAFSINPDLVLVFERDNN
jgi:spermidine/putrescine transport system ATP-binding protein